MGLMARRFLTMRPVTWVTPTDIPASEAAALKSLYDLTAGGSWTTSTNWGKTATAANWYGLTLVGGKVTRIQLGSNNLVGNVGSWDPSAFTTLQRLWLDTNTLSGTVTAWALANTVNNLNLGNNVSLVLNIASLALPTSLATLNIQTSSATGSIAGKVFPAGTQYIYYNDTTISGVPDLAACTGLVLYYCSNCGLTQANVDDLLFELYELSATPRTGANGIINVAGTNAAPSGVFQAAAACPVDGSTPGKEVAHELLNDGCAVGFNKWATVTVTA